MPGSGQKIDLGGFAYSTSEAASWIQSGTSGTLTVSDGAQTAQLSLIGTYVSSDFNLTTIMAGPYVDDPRAATPAATRFAEATAGFSGRGAGLAAIHDGGTALIGGGPLVTAATSGR
jgi:hypothetical protein